MVKRMNAKGVYKRCYIIMVRSVVWCPSRVTFSAVNNNLDRRFLQKDLDNLLIWADMQRQAGYWVLSTDLSKTKTETFYSAYTN